MLDIEHANTRLPVHLLAIPLLAGVLTGAAIAEPGRGDYTLSSAIPDDVFLFVQARHNPARQFLDGYWGEVLEAFHDSGIVADLLASIHFKSDAGDDEGHFERIKTRAGALVHAVDWSDLLGKEMAYAERMPDFANRPPGPDPGIPDFVFLFRNDPESTERNFKGLSAIAEAIVEEVNTLVDSKIVKIERREGAGVQSCCLSAISGNGDSPFSINVGKREDVIVVTVGRSMYDDVLGLLDGRSSKRSIAEDVRFRAAFAKLPPAADGFSFFDMRRLCSGVRGMFDAQKGGGDIYVNALVNDKVKKLNEKAIAAYRADDFPKALAIIREAHEQAPEDSLVMYNLACFTALNGHKEEALSWLERSVEGGFYAPNQITHDSDLKSLHDDTRFEAALEKATQLAREKRAVVEHVLSQGLEAAGLLEYVAEVTTTDGYATRTDTMAVLADDARQNMLFPVLAKRQPISDYDRYLPEQTTGYWVTSGIDLSALHDMLESAVRGMGPTGDELWNYWQQLQETLGFNLSRDLLNWLRGDIRFIELESEPGVSAWVVMIGLKEEAVAREKVSSILTGASDWLGELAKQNPMAGMLTIRPEPSTHQRLDGFHRIHRAMSPTPASVGVRDGWLFVSNREDAVALCLKTAAGEHPNVRHNKRIMEEALMPDSGIQTIEFKDQRNLGDEAAEIVQMISMAAGMATMGIPNPEAQKAIGKVCAILAKVPPVLRKIDFYKSTSSYTTFDGKAWHTRKVTNYKTQAERTATVGKL